MATTLTPTTELEAVNFMLSAVGQAPVNTIDIPGDAAVALARETLRTTSREVQTSGWHFNTEDEYVLARDQNSKIPVPQNALRVDTDGSSAWVDAVVRGGFLYDRKKHTFVFDKNLSCRIVFFLAFDQLPEAARWYITVRAARRFHAHTLGDDATARFTAEDELGAYNTFLLAEAEDGDHNMLSGSYSVANILRRY